MSRDPEPEGVPRPDVSRAVRPLRFVFWGALLCLVDVPLAVVSSDRLSIPFEVNDLAGLGLIAVGVFQLAVLPIAPSYRRAMTLAKAVTLLTLVVAFLDLGRPDPPGTLILVRTAVELFQIAAIPLFCLAIRLYCLECDRPDLSKRWLLTAWVFLWVNTLPSAIYTLSSAWYDLEGNPLHVHLTMGQFGVLLFPVSLVPLLLFYLSTSKLAAPDPGIRWEE